MSAETGVLVIPFDENTGTVTGDVSGNGNNGSITVVSSSPAWSSSGQYANCLNRSSANGLVTVTHASSINNLTTFTVTFWLQFTTAANGAIVYKSDGNVSAGWWIDRSASGIGIQICHSTTNVKRYFNTGIPATGGWHHYAFTWDGTKPDTSLHVYLDGTEVTYSTSTTGVGNHTTDAAVNLLLFSQTGGSSATFVGLLDQLRIYNTVLSSTQIGTDKNTQINAIGTASNTLGAASVSSAATVAIAATEATTLGVVTVSSAGTVAYATITGSASLTLGSVTDVAAGAVAVAGTESTTIGAATVAATGTVGIVATGSTTLGPVTEVASGTVLVTGSAAATLGTLAETSSGTDAVTGSSAVTLGDLALESTSTIAVAGTAETALDAMTGSGAGTAPALVAPAASGGGGGTSRIRRPSKTKWTPKAPVTSPAEVIWPRPRPEPTPPTPVITTVATGTARLGGLTAQSQGSVGIAAAGVARLDAMTCQGAGSTAIAAASAAEFGAMSCAAAVHVRTRFTLRRLRALRPLEPWPVGALRAK